MSPEKGDIKMSDIKDQLNAMQTVLLEVHDYTVGHKKDHNHIEKQIGEHHATLFGNGRRGLKSSVLRHSIYFAVIVGAPTVVLVILQIVKHWKEIVT